MEFKYVLHIFESYKIVFFHFFFSDCMAVIIVENSYIASNANNLLVGKQIIEVLLVEYVDVLNNKSQMLHAVDR